VGLEYQAHADKLHGFAMSELEDAIRLVEKVTALGGDPVTAAKQPDWVGDPRKALDRLIESENETLETMQAAGGQTP
jgi:hypothetical protein